MNRCRTTALGAILSLLALLASPRLQAANGLELLQQLNDFAHARQIEFLQEPVLDYEVGLGAMQKISGAWQFKHSERVSGNLTAYTWQIVDGFTSIEVMTELVGRVEQLEQARLLFACESRACGQGVQWANRVFHQAVLYGREDRQRYRVYSLGSDPRNLLIIYASARTTDRQYLHAQWLEVSP